MGCCTAVLNQGVAALHLAPSHGACVVHQQAGTALLLWHQLLCAVDLVLVVCGELGGGQVVWGVWVDVTL